MHSRALQRIASSLAAPVTVAVVVGALVAGCSDKKDVPATQAAAKVNKEELTVHQINAVLSQQRGLRPEQGEEASRRVLERLIDQELAVQKAAELKLDRDPRVVQAIEAARREIVARAYAEKIGERVPKPAPEEIRKYYDENPALFRERRIYQLHEFVAQATPEQAAMLRGKLQSSRSSADVAQLLRGESIKYVSNLAVRTAEQVPLGLLGELAKLKDGQLLVTTGASGTTVLLVVASRSQPIDEVHAAPAIEQFLLNDRKRKLVAQDLKALRAAAKIEYVGHYSGAAPPVEAPTGPSVADAAASAAAAIEVKSAAEAFVRPAGDADAATIRKGLGLK